MASCPVSMSPQADKRGGALAVVWPRVARHACAPDVCCRCLMRCCASCGACAVPRAGVLRRADDMMPGLRAHVWAASAKSTSRSSARPWLSRWQSPLGARSTASWGVWPSTSSWRRSLGARCTRLMVALLPVRTLKSRSSMSASVFADPSFGPHVSLVCLSVWLKGSSPL